MRTFREIGLACGTDKVRDHHYDPWYERHLGPLRSRPITLLEFGVYKGASLRMWEEYFPKARIFGVDNDPACRAHAGGRKKVLIGDQADAAFLGRVVAETGPLDVAVDDGGHRMNQQLISFRALFPRVRQGGFYVVEDLQTSFIAYYGGGVAGKPGTMMARLKDAADQLMWAQSDRPPYPPSGPVLALHLYPRICFVERA